MNIKSAGMVKLVSHLASTQKLQVRFLLSAPYMAGLWLHLLPWRDKDVA